MSFKLLRTGRAALRRGRIGRVVLAAAAICVATVPLPSFAAEITMDNLVHRWSFSGNFDDTGSGAHQTVQVVSAADGNVVLDSGVVRMQAPGSNNSSYNKGHVNLGTNLIPTDADGVTIEIFATLKQARMWERVFSYGTSSFKIDMCWTKNSSDSQDLFICSGLSNQNDTMQPFTVGTQWHISIVLKKDKNGGTWLRWMKRAVSTGEIAKYNSTRIGTTVAAVGADPQFSLGGSLFGETDDAYADYDEVRIWNVALDDGQLSANAKAGPDTIPEYATPDSYAAYISTEDGTARYIDTGLVGRSGTKVEAKFRQTSTRSQWPVLIGADNSSGDRFHPIAFHDYYQLHFQYRGTSYSMIYNPGDYNTDLIVTSDFKADGSATVVVADTSGNELANVTKSDIGAAFDTGRNMYLLACNGRTWCGDNFFGRCYYVKIWQTDENGEYQLVRDYVPCIKDEMAGMYDKVSSTIFYQTGSSPFGYELAGAPETALWNGTDTSASTPANWLCYDSSSALINNALPSSGTAVTVDSNDPVPSVDSTIGWNSLVLGSASDKSGAIAFTTGASATFNALSIGVAGSGSVTMNGSAAMAVNGNVDTYLGRNGGASGTLSMAGNATAQFNALDIGYSGTGNMTVGDNAAVTISGYSSIGCASGGRGTVTQTGGTVTTGNHNDAFNVGRDGTGTYNLSGGTLNLNQVLRIGWGGYSSGNKFNMTGGTLNLGNNIFILGDWAQNNEFNMTAGTITCGSGLWYIGGYSSNSTGTGTFTQDGGDITLGNTISIGYQRGTGAYVMNGGTLSERWWISIGRDSGTGTFTQNGGAVTLSGGMNGSNPHCWISLAPGSNGTGTYTLNGGTLDIASGITFGENSTGGTGRFEMNGGTNILRTIVKANENVAATLALNGGTLRAKISNASFLDSLGEVTVGNITIDTTDNSYALGVTSGTTFAVTPNANPAITLTGSGSLDLSGVTVDLSSKPSANVYVLANVADGATGTFSGEPSVTMPGLRVRKSADGKSICLVRPGLTIIVH